MLTVAILWMASRASCSGTLPASKRPSRQISDRSHQSRYGARELVVPECCVVKIADRPDLIPVVAEWLWASFWQQLGYNYRETHDVIASGIARLGAPQTFVLLVDGDPVGTASLAAQDLDARPDLTP